MTLEEALARIEELEYELAELRHEIGAEVPLWREKWKLTPGEAMVMNMLVARQSASRISLMTALHGADWGDRVVKIIDAYICRIRKKVVGVEITTLHGQGYAMSPGWRKHVMELAKEY
jgi:DNA-binding response OmpR family regulator